MYLSGLNRYDMFKPMVTSSKTLILWDLSNEVWDFYSWTVYGYIWENRFSRGVVNGGIRYKTSNEQKPWK